MQAFETEENLFASIAGWLSILCWIVVFSPQIYDNYRHKSGDSLSLWFLWIWLLGDIFNIAGAVMENLLLTIILLAVYYTLADLVLIVQVYHYRNIARQDSLPEEYERLLSESRNARQQRQRQEQEQQQPTVNAFYDDPDSIIPIASSSLTSPNPPEEEESTKCDFKRDFLYPFLFVLCTAIITSATITCILQYGVAQFFGWASAILYIGSRIPQISKNAHNQSTGGLSIYMFIFSILGNGLYVASIFLQSTEKTHIYKNLPWLVGSAGTLILDVCIGTQFIVYTKEPKGKEPAILDRAIV